jgi:hypothetical protein
VVVNYQRWHWHKGEVGDRSTDSIKLIPGGNTYCNRQPATAIRNNAQELQECPLHTNTTINHQESREISQWCRETGHNQSTGIRESGIQTQRREAEGGQGDRGTHHLELGAVYGEVVVAPGAGDEEDPRKVSCIYTHKWIEEVTGAGPSPGMGWCWCRGGWGGQSVGEICAGASDSGSGGGRPHHRSPEMGNRSRESGIFLTSSEFFWTCYEEQSSGPGPDTILSPWAEYFEAKRLDSISSSLDNQRFVMPPIWWEIIC